MNGPTQRSSHRLERGKIDRGDGEKMALILKLVLELVCRSGFDGGGFNGKWVPMGGPLAEANKPYALEPFAISRNDQFRSVDF